MLSIPASIALIVVIMLGAFSFLIGLYLVMAEIEQYGFVGAIRHHGAELRANRKNRR